MTAGRITNIFAAFTLALGLPAALGCKKAIEHAAARSPGRAPGAGTIFSNAYFGFSISVPRDWSVVSLSRTNAPEPGSDTWELLLISEKPLGTQTDSNSSLLVVAEKASISGANSPREYLEYITRIYSDSVVRQGKMTIPFATDGKVQDLQLGGRAGARANLTATIGQRKALQSYFSTILKDYVVSVVISAMNDADLRRLEAVVESARFAQP